MFSQSNNYDPFGFPFGTSHANGWRRQEFARVEEERRRQAESKGRKRVEEEMARRREMEMLRRERNEMEQRRRQGLAKEQLNEKKTASYPQRQRTVGRGPDRSLYRVGEEKMAHRRGMEMLSRESSDMEQMRRRSLAMNQPSEKKTASYPQGTVVRGPDSNLYRVSAPPRREKDDNVESRSNIEFDSAPAFLNGLSGPVLVSDENKNHDEEENSDSTQESHEYQDINDDSQMTAAETASPVRKPLHQIIVEDVPDDEDEEIREMRSVWRNRIPSPGQWMEPVESFLGQ